MKKQLLTVFFWMRAWIYGAKLDSLSQFTGDGTVAELSKCGINCRGDPSLHFSLPPSFFLSANLSSLDSVHVCESHTYTIRGIIRDYKSFNSRANAWLALLLYVCVAHIHEPNPSSLFSPSWSKQRLESRQRGLRRRKESWRSRESSFERMVLSFWLMDYEHLIPSREVIKVADFSPLVLTMDNNILPLGICKIRRVDKIRELTWRFVGLHCFNISWGILNSK